MILFTKIIAKKRKGFLDGTIVGARPMVLNGLLAQCGTTGDAALRLIGKKKEE